MTHEVDVTVERIDDFVLLLHMMMQMKLPAMLDQHLPSHWRQQGLSWGWVTTIWLAHIVSQGDHRKVTVREWVQQAHQTLEKVTGLTIRETDFTDDRLAIVLKHLSQPERWQGLEAALSGRLMRVYELPQEVVRVDTTTVSGYHAIRAEGVMHFGYSKDDPTLPQVKVVMASLDPLGLPLATVVVPGETADDRLYVPAIQQVLVTMRPQGLLFVGDSKMSALDTRAYVHQAGQYYLMPLAMVGETGQAWPQWVAEAIEKEKAHQLSKVLRPGDAEHEIAQGYEFNRACTASLNGQPLTWSERVLVIHSLAQAQKEKAIWQRRLQQAETALLALTPPRGRGRRQITEEAILQQRMEAILNAYGLQGVLTCAYERQVEQQTRFLNRGRGSPQRPQQTTERVRYQVTAVQRQEAALAALEARLGWRAYASNAPASHLSLSQAVLTYRQEYIIEQRGFGRLKGAPLSIAPLYVKRDDQIIGLTYLLTLAVTVLNLIEFVVRRNLQQRQTALLGLYPQNPRQATTQPTAERLLKAFSRLNLTIIHLPHQQLSHVTPLSPLQEQILDLLGLSPDIYRSLAVEILNTS